MDVEDIIRDETIDQLNDTGHEVIRFLLVIVILLAIADGLLLGIVLGLGT